MITDGTTLLAGLWLAVSPWVVGFDRTAPGVRVSNPIMGVAVAVTALGLTLMPQRMVRLSWATAVIGAWVVVSQWIIQQSPGTTPHHDQQCPDRSRDHGPRYSRRLDPDVGPFAGVTARGCGTSAPP